MPKSIKSDPKYRHYKPKDLAVVRIDGKDIYLGRYGSPESWSRYYKVLAEWRASGQRPAVKPAAGDEPPLPTIEQLALGYYRHAERYYRLADGTPSQELANIKHALRPLRRLYGTTPAEEFDQLALQAVREDMIRSGLARPTINARIHRIRRAFRWAVGVKLYKGTMLADLVAVENLHAGRTEAPEPPPVEPVPLPIVEATLPFMPPAVAAMVKLQLLTGARMGEVLIMRGCDIKTAEGVWEYRPASHKNTWRGHTRFIAIGPRAIDVVKPFVGADPDAYLFAPRDTVKAHHEQRAARRKSRPTPSEKRRRTTETPGAKRAARYDRRSYRQAIVRACDRAFPHPQEAELLAQLDAAPKGRRRAAHRALAEQLAVACSTGNDLDAWRSEIAQLEIGPFFRLAVAVDDGRRCREVGGLVHNLCVLMRETRDWLLGQSDQLAESYAQMPLTPYGKAARDRSIAARKEQIAEAGRERLLPLLHAEGAERYFARCHRLNLDPSDPEVMREMRQCASFYHADAAGMTLDQMMDALDRHEAENPAEVPAPAAPLKQLDQAEGTQEPAEAPRRWTKAEADAAVRKVLDGNPRASLRDIQRITGVPTSTARTTPAWISNPHRGRKTLEGARPPAERSLSDVQLGLIGSRADDPAAIAEANEAAERIERFLQAMTPEARRAYDALSEEEQFTQLATILTGIDAD